MKNFSPYRIRSLAVRTAVAAAVIAACAGASAASFDPTSVGISAPSFEFDTLTVNDFASISSSGTSFSETGDLSISSVSLGGTTFTPTGFGTDYGLYVTFTASGSSGVLTSLNYNVFAYTGPFATFDVTAAGATKSGSVGTLVGGGMLLPGTGNSYGGDGVNFAYLAANTLSFGSIGGAFSSATSAFASFTNDKSTLFPSDSGFLVKGGGGTIHITSAVPEPETYALMLGGLAAVGFVSRRRANG